MATDPALLNTLTGNPVIHTMDRMPTVSVVMMNLSHAGHHLPHHHQSHLHHGGKPNGVAQSTVPVSITQPMATEWQFAL